MFKLAISTTTREEMVNITSIIQAAISENNWQDGMLLIYCPHTTGAVTINEGADPDVVRDIVVNLRKLIPKKGDYRHMEGNSDAHLKSSFFGPEQMVIVEKGSVMLGTWQRIFFCEFDGPRNRTLWLKFMAG